VSGRMAFDIDFGSGYHGMGMRQLQTSHLDLAPVTGVDKLQELSRGMDPCRGRVRSCRDKRRSSHS